MQWMLHLVLFILCLSASSAVIRVDMRHSKLNDYRMIVKDWGGFLMETCLLRPVGNTTSASPAGVKGRVGGQGERRERSLPESTCRTCPRAPPVNNPATVTFSFTLCLGCFLGLLFPSLPILLYPSLFIYLLASHPLCSFASRLLWHYKTNNSHLSRCASVGLSFSLHSKLLGTALTIVPKEAICLGNFWSESNKL